MPKSDSSRHRVPPYKRPLVVGGFLAVLAVVILSTVLICKSFLGSSDDSQVKNPNDNPGTDQSVDTPPEVKPAEPDELDHKTPQFEGEDPNELNELTGHIIYKDIDSANQVLHSAVMINQYLQSDGQCVFNLKRDDAILRTASAAATADITTSVCGPFDVSVEGLSPGNYHLEIIVTGDGKRGVITDDLDI